MTLGHDDSTINIVTAAIIYYYQHGDYMQRSMHHYLHLYMLR